ncbi:MAG: hypothetical protein ABI823_06030 [Bryobacteraceae bacterium]
MTRRTFHSVAALAAFSPRALWAEDAKDILMKATEVYDGLRSYSFEGKSVSETTIKGKTSKTEFEFDVAFQAPNKFRLEFRYPNAGNWLRACDGSVVHEYRSMTKESKRTPANEDSLRVLNGSPIFNFERLSQTAENTSLVRSEPIELDGKKIECQLIQFTSHRRALREGEQPGQSMVWVAKKDGIVLREEIRTTASLRGELSESKRTTSIEKFRINEDLPVELFSSATKK